MKARLSLFYKARNNLIALQIPQYYQTRHNDTRLRHQHFLTFEHHRTSTVSSLKTINEWKTLPSFVATSDSLAAFQNNIKYNKL